MFHNFTNTLYTIYLLSYIKHLNLIIIYNRILHDASNDLEAFRFINTIGSATT